MYQVESPSAGWLESTLRVETSDTLGQLLQGHHGGDKVTVSWTDSSGKRHTGSVTLIAGPAN